MEECIVTMRLTAVLIAGLLASSLFTASGEARGGGFGGGAHFGGFGAASHIGGVGVASHMGGSKLGGVGRGLRGSIIGGVHVGGAGVISHAEGTNARIGAVGSQAGISSGTRADHPVGSRLALHHRATNDSGINDEAAIDCLDWQELHPTEPKPPTCG